MYEVFGVGDSISNSDAISQGWVVKNGWGDDPDFERVDLWTRYLDSFYFRQVKIMNFASVSRNFHLK